MEQSDKGSVYVVVVSGKLKPGQMEQFIENFKPLAKHVTEEEEGTLTYQLSTGGDDPDRLCIYERSVCQRGSLPPCNLKYSSSLLVLSCMHG